LSSTDTSPSSSRGSSLLSIDLNRASHEEKSREGISGLDLSYSKNDSSVLLTLNKHEDSIQPQRHTLTSNSYDCSDISPLHRDDAIESDRIDQSRRSHHDPLIKQPNPSRDTEDSNNLNGEMDVDSMLRRKQSSFTPPTVHSMISPHQDTNHPSSPRAKGHHQKPSGIKSMKQIFDKPNSSPIVPVRPFLSYQKPNSIVTNISNSRSTDGNGNSNDSFHDITSPRQYESVSNDAALTSPIAKNPPILKINSIFHQNERAKTVRTPTVDRTKTSSHDDSNLISPAVLSCRSEENIELSSDANETSTETNASSVVGAFDSQAKDSKLSDQVLGPEDDLPSPSKRESTCDNRNLNLNNVLSTNASTPASSPFKRVDDDANTMLAVHTYEELKAPGPYPSEVNPDCREVYLSTDEFYSLFRMNLSQFKALPKWKQIQLKKSNHLF
jgi:hypothetical protein